MARIRADVLALSCAAGTLLAEAAAAVDLVVESHMSAMTVELIPGGDRGTITMPLRSGTIDGTGQAVLFVVTDASDREFADLFGAIFADALAQAPEAAVEAAVFDAPTGQWTFFHDPGRVARFDAADEDGDGDTAEVLPPLANPGYSPLKRITWNGRTVTVNAPFVKWGDGPGQQLVIDHGGCDPLIRRNPPSPFFVGGGPADGADCSQEAPLDRYKGAQVVGLDTNAMTVAMKLHAATFDHPKVVPYYVVFDASKGPPAGFMGVPHVPKLASLGRFGDNPAVGKIAQFSNGVRNDAGGPNRFQPGITSYPGGSSMTYTPMWHITWVFFDCDGDGVFFDEEHSVAFGAEPVAGSGIPGFDPADPASFDPFGMDDNGVDCPGFAVSATGQLEGFIDDLSSLTELVEAGAAIETDGPPGLPLDHPLQPNLVVNCPVPLTVRSACAAADLNEDETVTIVDLFMMFAQWGTDPGGPPDLDGDGIVGISDLFILFAVWGPCF